MPAWSSHSSRQPSERMPGAEASRAVVAADHSECDPVGAAGFDAGGVGGGIGEASDRDAETACSSAVGYGLEPDVVLADRPEALVACKLLRKLIGQQAGVHLCVEQRDAGSGRHVQVLSFDTLRSNWKAAKTSIAGFGTKRCDSSITSAIRCGVASGHDPGRRTRLPAAWRDNWGTSSRSLTRPLLTHHVNWSCHPLARLLALWGDWKR